MFHVKHFFAVVLGTSIILQSVAVENCGFCIEAFAANDSDTFKATGNLLSNNLSKVGKYSGFALSAKDMVRTTLTINSEVTTEAAVSLNGPLYLNANKYASAEDLQKELDYEHKEVEIRIYDDRKAFLEEITTNVSCSWKVVKNNGHSGFGNVDNFDVYLFINAMEFTDKDGRTIKFDKVEMKFDTFYLTFRKPDETKELEKIKLPFSTTKEEILNSLPKSVGFENSSEVSNIIWDDYFVYNPKEDGQTITIIGEAAMPEYLNYSNGYSFFIEQTVVILPKEKNKIKLNGTEKVGNTLSVASEHKEDIEKYQWYRLNNCNDAIENGELISEDSKYELTSKDKGKYIALLVTFKDGNSQKVITEIISKNSSSSSKSSSSSNKSDNSEEKSVVSEVNDVIDQSDDLQNLNKNINIAQNFDGTIRLTDINGNSLTGWQFHNSQWYLGDENGNALTGWQQVNGTWYYLNENGAMVTGWQQVNGTWYYLNENGAMATGWQQVNGTWYYLNENGAMATGWQQVNGTWYYLNENGAMATNTIINGYRVNSSGAWV